MLELLCGLCGFLVGGLSGYLMFVRPRRRRRTKTHEAILKLRDEIPTSDTPPEFHAPYKIPFGPKKTEPVKDVYAGTKYVRMVPPEETE